MKKRNFVVLILVVLISHIMSISTISVYAEEITEYESEIEPEYIEKLNFMLSEIDQNGSVTEEFVDENNIVHTLTVEVEPNSNGNGYGIMSLSNKTYVIKHTKNNSYEASFKLDISSNRIQSAHSGYVKVFRGTLSDKKLTKVSSIKAQQTFKQS